MGLVYDELDETLQEIRLVHIEPRKDPTSPMKCTLHTVSLKKPPKFQALSYVWGTTETTESIVVDNESMQVTPNLASALRSLRYPHRKRVMWIDYICINQNNQNEKNTQVPLMGAIYQKANRVIAMLGDTEANFGLAISWADRYMLKRLSKRAWYWWKLDAKCLLFEEARREKEIAILDVYHAMKCVYKLPYWTRTWTYQEYQLPEREPVSVCSGISFQASSLPQAAYYKIATLTMQIRGSHTHDDFNADSRRKAHIEALLSHAVNHDLEGPINLVYTLMDVARVGHHWNGLFHLLRMTSHRQCANPRDRIYGLYALAPAVQQAYPPDYNKSVEQVMIETTKYLIQNDVLLFLFHTFPVRSDHLSNNRLPSWVPDYTQTSLRMTGAGSQFIGSWVEESLAKIVSGRLPHILDDLKTLSIWARPAGCCKVAFHFGSDLDEVITKIMDVIEGNNQSLNTVFATSESFLLACLYHHRDYAAFSIDEIRYTITQMSHHPETDDVEVRGRPDIKSDCWRMLQKALTMTCGQTVFIIHNSFGGGFGIGPVRVEDEDVVVLACSAKQPLVLRRGSTRGDETQQYYKLVSQAFVDGIGERQDPETSMFTGLKKQPYEEYLLV